MSQTNSGRTTYLYVWCGASMPTNMNKVFSSYQLCQIAKTTSVSGTISVPHHQSNDISQVHFIVSLHLRLGLPSGYFRSCFVTKISHALLISTMRATFPASVTLFSHHNSLLQGFDSSACSEHICVQTDVFHLFWDYPHCSLRSAVDSDTWSSFRCHSSHVFWILLLVYRLSRRRQPLTTPPPSVGRISALSTL